jgi:hypothetical protein
MIIRSNEISIQYLALQVLETCPRDRGVAFTSGFTAFVECFFEDLDAFNNKEGSFEVDLNVVMEHTLSGLQSFFNNLPLEQRKNYWLGISAGAECSESILKFAFEVNTTNEAA